MQRLSAWLGLSLAIHAGLATVALHALGGTELPVLFIDLRDLAAPGGGTPAAGRDHGEGAVPVAGPSPPARTLARRGAPAAASRSAAPVASAPRESPPAMAPPAPTLEPTLPQSPEPPRVQLDAAPVPEPAAPAAPVEIAPPVIASGPSRPTGAGRGDSVSSLAGAGSPSAGAPAGSAAASGSAATGGSGLAGDSGGGAAGSRDGAALARGVPGDGAGDGVPDMMYDELLRRLRRALDLFEPRSLMEQTNRTRPGRTPGTRPGRGGPSGHRASTACRCRSPRGAYCPSRRSKGGGTADRRAKAAAATTSRTPTCSSPRPRACSAAVSPARGQRLRLRRLDETSARPRETR